jgi:YVTN family beta-propeller protein
MEKKMLKLNLARPVVLAIALLAGSQLMADDAPALLLEPSERILRAKVAPGLYEIVYSPAQDAVFVASAGGRGEDAEPARILRLNPETLETEGEIVLPGRGFGLALDDESNRLYVGDSMNASITVIDLGTNSVVGSVQLAEKVMTDKGKEEFPYAIRELVIDAEHGRLYAPGLALQDSALYVVETSDLSVEKVLPGFGAGVTGITLDAVRDRLYVSNLSGELYTLDTNGPDILSRAEVEGDQLLNLALDASGNRIFATDQGNEFITKMRADVLPDYKLRGEGNRVLVMDAANGETIRLLPVGAGPVAPLVGGDRLYVTNRDEGTVSVFDTESYELVEEIGLPAHPNSLALDPGRNALFVTVKNGHGEKGAESVVRIDF